MTERRGLFEKLSGGKHPRERRCKNAEVGNEPRTFKEPEEGSK